MTTENQSQNSSDELDLFYILKKAYNACCSALGSILKFLLRKSLWLLIAAMLGAVFSYYVFSKSKKYYTSTVQLISKNVPCDLIISQIDALNGLLINRDYKSLSLMLNLPDTALKEVKSIKALYAIDANKDHLPDYADILEKVKKNPQDTSIKKMHDYFYLRLEVFSEKAFPSVASSLKSYIRRNTFLQDENALAIGQKERLLEEVKKQVTRLDSFQRTEYFEKNKTANQQFILNGNGDKSLYHNQYINLFSQQQGIEKDLQLYPDVITVVQDFPPLSRPENTMMSYFKSYVPAFLLLGLLCALLWTYRKTLWKYIKEKD